MPHARDPRSETHSIVRVALITTLFLGLALLVFVWPAANIEPRDLPLGLVGSPEHAAAFAERAGPPDGAFDLTGYPDEVAAIRAIENRDIYGALVLGGEQGAQVLIASAASPMVAQLLQQLAASPDGQPESMQVVDVVPGTSSDPRAAAFASALFPLLISGTAAGVLAIMLIAGTWGRLTAIGAAALLAGGVAAVIVQTWLDLIGGNWLLVAGVYSLTVFAIAAAIAGLAALWGTPGAGLGAFLVILLGNAWSGVTSAPEMLPQPLGTLGQLLPPGAAASLLRGVAFFGGSGSVLPLTVLLVWSAAGIAAVAVATSLGVRSRRAGDPLAEPVS